MYRAFAVFLILLIAVFAIELRVESSSARLAHADEGEQAWTFLKLYNTGEYAYSPDGAHGATLYYWAYFSKKVEGIFIEPSLEISSLRLTLLPVFLLSMLAFFVLLPKLGFSCVCASLVAWGVSALSVLYSVYFVQEIFFAFAVFLSMGYLYLAITRAKLKDFVFLGLSCGLAQATKESFVIVLGALFLPSAYLAYIEKIEWNLALAKKVSLSLLSAFFVYAIFYSSFGTNPRGIIDGVLSYLHFFDKSQGDIHAKDFLYYARILFVQKSQGVYFGEWQISVFAIIGGAIGFAKRQKLISYIASFCVGYFLILSAIPYKTPWLLLSLIMPMCVLFGYAFSVGFRSKNIIAKICSVIILICVIVLKVESTKLATQRFANDPRNSLTYVHTTSDVRNFLKRIEQVKQDSPEAEIAFFMKNSPFPLPYYLLKYKNVSYNIEKIDADVIVTDDSDFLTSISGDTYEEEFYGLRENLIIYVYIKREIFERIIEE